MCRRGTREGIPASLVLAVNGVPLNPRLDDVGNVGVLIYVHEAQARQTNI